MTPEQLLTLKAAILADPVLAAKAGTADGRYEIAAALNLTAAPDYWVWRTSVSTDALQADPGFDWTRVDNLTIGKARIWEWITSAPTINPSQANVRAGFAATWAAAGDAATLAAILGVCRRKCRRAEKLFVVASPNGVGTRGSTSNPDTMTFEGSVTAGNVEAALNA